MALSKEQLAKVNEKVNSGDKEAMKFIVNYPYMSEEEANAYLTKLAMGSSNPNEQETRKGDMGDMIAFLIKDENEAINGYDKAILLAQSVSCEKALSIFKPIKEDDLRHIQMLKDLQDELVQMKVGE